MNILVLTTIYQHPDDSKDSATTPVVHNFAKVWAKQGHKVIVVHNFNVFVKVLYYMPNFVKDFVSNLLGFRSSLNPEQCVDMAYKRDGVDIYRVPILKLIPMGSYMKVHLEKQLSKIRFILDSNDFVPDIIVAHAENPQVYQLYYLKKQYNNAKTALVLHGIDYLNRRSFSRWKEEFFPYIDIYGFRSQSIGRKAKEFFVNVSPSFMCPSGIQNQYVEQKTYRYISNVKKLLFVGQLIERKHPLSILEAVNAISDKYEITFIGEGSQANTLKKYAKKHSIDVSFLGKIPHKQVLEKMREADCFIMISEAEVFGLVYLEAMSQGCITIASRGEGMEGIIIDGENGFLCESGDSNMLIYILDKIGKLSSNELELIQNAAFETARRYSEENVANAYLDEVENAERKIIQ